MKLRRTLLEEVEVVASMCRRLQAEAARNPPPDDVTIPGVLGMVARQLEDIVRRHKVKSS